MMKLVYLFTLICVATANNLSTAIINKANQAVYCSKWVGYCSYPNCPGDYGSNNFDANFAAMTSSKQCACAKDVAHCISEFCDGSDVKEGCNGIIDDLLKTNRASCEVNCYSLTELQNWQILANNVNQAIISCDSNNDCVGKLPSCPSSSSSNFGTAFRALPDPKKCACLNEAIQCAYARCKPADVKNACVNMVNEMKSHGLSKTCSSINCNAGFAGAIPSFAIIGSCLMLLLGIMWAH